jgi:YD repeat-containing protein
MPTETPRRVGREDASGTRPDGVSTVLQPSARSQRDRLVRLGAMIIIAALPIAAILLALVNWQVALGFMVVWTVGLMFGVRQQRSATLRLDDAGLQYEAGMFVLRATWDDLDRIGEVTLPSGKTQAIVLHTSGLRWTHTPQVRQQVSSKGWDRIVPIDEFAPRWPQGRLGDALRTHRPDLMSDVV